MINEERIFLNIEEQVMELERNLINEPTEYKGFITAPGINFQDNFKELMKIIQASNILPRVLNIFYPLAIDYIEKEYNNQEDQISIQASGKVIITQKNKEPIINTFEFNESNLFAVLRQSINEIPKEIIDVISQVIARLNSYYFLALYAYLDLYSLSIYKLIISELDETKIFKLMKNFRVLSNPLAKISQIKRSLNLVVKYELNKESKIESWEKDFDKFINQRHSIAHRDPVVEILSLDAEYQEIVKKAKEKSTTKIDELFQDFKSQKEVYAKIANIFGDILQTLYILMEFGASCFKYLALIDIVVDDYIRNNK